MTSNKSSPIPPSSIPSPDSAGNTVPISPAIKITGVKINYYHICHTKLWLFCHNIALEHEHENVNIGKQLHEDRYRRNTKDVTIDDTISIDFVKRSDVIELHEIKKTKQMEDAHISQMLFYLYYLKQKGVDAKGVMNYPLLNQTRKVIMTPDDEQDIEHDIRRIEEIAMGRMPHPKRMRICPKCAYFEFCFCGEAEG